MHHNSSHKQNRTNTTRSELGMHDLYGIVAAGAAVAVYMAVPDWDVFFRRHFISVGMAIYAFLVFMAWLGLRYYLKKTEDVGKLGNIFQHAWNPDGPSNISTCIWPLQ